MTRQPATVRRPMAEKRAEAAPHPARVLLATWRWPLLTPLAPFCALYLSLLALR